MMLRLLLSAAIPITLLFGTATAQPQTTWHVDDDNCPGPGSGTEADPFCKIQDGINATTDGDEVVVAPGTYNEIINFNGKAITLRSSKGPDVTIIDARRLGTVISCNNGEGPETTLEGFTITGGISGNGGGMSVHFNSSPTIRDCVFRNNLAGAGGGIVVGGPATVIGCRFEGNTAQQGGGMWLTGGGTVSNCIFKGNVASSHAGGVIASGDVTIADSIFVGNIASDRGGALGVSGGNGIPTIIGCIFSENYSGRWGAGVNIGDNPNTPVNAMFTGCFFVRNQAADAGGAMRVYWGSSPVVTGCTFVNNTSIFAGGGMLNHSMSDPTVSDSLFCGNVPDDISGPYEDGGGNQFPKQCPATGACCVKGVCAVLTPALCTSVKGVYQGDDAACEEATCSQECPADLDPNGEVGAFDLALLLGSWGPCP